MHGLAKFLTCTVTVGANIFLTSSSCFAVATFDAISEQTFRDWKMSLYRNRNGGRYFCAAATTAKDGTIFRINVYRNTQDAFVEFFNPRWTLEAAKVRFELKSETGSSVELEGESWGDSLTHDLVDGKAMLAMTRMLLDAKSIKLFGPAKTSLAEFSLNGIKEASRLMLDCSSPK